MTPISIGGEKQASISGGVNPPADIASGILEMDMECRHIKRQDFLILNLLYIMPKKRLDF